MRSSNHSPLDSTGSAAESIISSSAVNDESNHGISNAADDDDAHKELSSKDLNDSSTTLNETGFEDVTKASAIDASSTNEDDDSGNYFLFFDRSIHRNFNFPFFFFFCS